jgi:hypothetical protein
MSDLSYYTTDQLVTELLSRHTFCGILVRSRKEVRCREAHQVWSLETTCNLQDEQVHDVLTDIAEQLGEKIAKLS